ncbi:MAG TPA: outer membrane lipoprotein-sorting protein [Nevskiales bacterium]|nr:outer membrane lipoprotein-sorting protein [Nevskiales bacterium]
MRIVCGLMLLLLAPSVLALEKAEDIRACVRQNYPARSSTQAFVLASIGRDGTERSLQATAYWKRGSDGRAKVMLQVDKPDDLRGSSYLLLEKPTRDDLFMYLPAVNRVKRIQGSQMSDSLWGTDFSYEDVKQLQGIFDAGTLTREADADVAGKKLYVLAFTPAKVEESAYKRIVSRIDPATCVALQTDFFQTGDTPRKRLTIDPKEVRPLGTRWMPHLYEMQDLHNQTRTVLRIDKVSADVELPERLFNPQTFYLGK